MRGKACAYELVGLDVANLAAIKAGETSSLVSSRLGVVVSLLLMTESRTVCLEWESRDLRRDSTLPARRQFFERVFRDSHLIDPMTSPLPPCQWPQGTELLL